MGGEAEMENEPTPPITAVLEKHPPLPLPTLLLDSSYRRFYTCRDLSSFCSMKDSDRQILAKSL
jgi:hypothetical protein